MSVGRTKTEVRSGQGNWSADCTRTALMSDWTCPRESGGSGQDQSNIKKQNTNKKVGTDLSRLYTIPVLGKTQEQAGNNLVVDLPLPLREQSSQHQYIHSEEILRQEDSSQSGDTGRQKSSFHQD